MENGKSRGLYSNILKNNEYRKLLFSNLINRFGDSVESIALIWIVYRITHSAAWSAIVFALNTLPNVLVQPFAGAFVEKLNKKNRNSKSKKGSKGNSKNSKNSRNRKSNSRKRRNK